MAIHSRARLVQNTDSPAGRRLLQYATCDFRVVPDLLYCFCSEVETVSYAGTGCQTQGNSLNIVVTCNSGRRW